MKKSKTDEKDSWDAYEGKSWDSWNSMLPLSKVARLKERKKNKSKRSAPTTKLLIRHLRHFGARETVKGSESVECTENLLILQVCLASACEIFRRYFYSHVVGDVSGQSNLESGSDFDINNRLVIKCILRREVPIHSVLHSWQMLYH